MKKKNQYSLLFATLILFLLACKKSNEELAYYRISDETLSFIKLIPGTHYIYNDSASGFTDSLIVTESSFLPKQEYSLPSGDKYSADYFHLVLKKASPAGTLSDWLDAVVENPGYEAFLIANAGSGKYLFWSPYTTIPGFEVKASAVINGVTYQNIHCFNLSNGETCWWVKNVGFIKITNQSSAGLQTFTLLKKG